MKLAEQSLAEGLHPRLIAEAWHGHITLSDSPSCVPSIELRQLVSALGRALKSPERRRSNFWIPSRLLCRHCQLAVQVFISPRPQMQRIVSALSLPVLDSTFQPRFSSCSVHPIRRLLDLGCTLPSERVSASMCPNDNSQPCEYHKS